MNRRKQQPNCKGKPGISLAEILIVVALSGLLAVLSLNLITSNPSKAWARVTEDYFKQLSAVYQKAALQHGKTPLTATDVNGVILYADGMETLLKDWEILDSYNAGPPQTISYPEGVLLYLDPEDNNIPDPNNELPINQAGNPATIMADTNNNEWLLLDLNGTDAPNTLKTTTEDGDRVLIYVEDNTGRIITAWQKCNEIKGNPKPYAGTSCTLSATAPNRTYYKSLYDVYKGI